MAFEKLSGDFIRGYTKAIYTVKTVHNETDAYEYGKFYAG